MYREKLSAVARRSRAETEQRLFHSIRQNKRLSGDNEGDKRWRNAIGLEMPGSAANIPHLSISVVNLKGVLSSQMRP